ncbi:MAG: helix-hairpin-helix domain-containing protein [Actinomycetes bacterium]
MPLALLARSPHHIRGVDARTAARVRLQRVLEGLRTRCLPDPGEVAATAVATADAAADATADVTADVAETREGVGGAPASRPVRARLGVDAPAAAGVVLVAVLGVLIGALYLWRSRPVPVPPPRATVVSAAAPSPSDTPSPSTVVVDVAGKVREPGVFTLPEGSRVVDALEAAGGPRRGADTTSLNLARVLADGEQVLVGVPGAPPAGGAAVDPAAGGLLDLNTATLDQLEELPGVGPVLGQRIIDHRTSIGGFSSVDELLEVSGIGEQTLADVQPLVRV